MPESLGQKIFPFLILMMMLNCIMLSGIAGSAPVVSLLTAPLNTSFGDIQKSIRKYEVYKLVDKGELKAMIAFRTMNVFGMRACIIMDFLSSDEVGGEALMKTVSDIAKENALDIIVAATLTRNQAIHF